MTDELRWHILGVAKHFPRTGYSGVRHTRLWNHVLKTHRRMCGRGMGLALPLARLLCKEREGGLGRWWDWRPINYLESYFTKPRWQIVSVSLGDKRRISINGLWHKPTRLCLASSKDGEATRPVKALDRCSAGWQLPSAWVQLSLPVVFFLLSSATSSLSTLWDTFLHLVIGNESGVQEYWGDSHDSRGQGRKRRGRRRKTETRGGRQRVCSCHW